MRSGLVDVKKSDLLVVAMNDIVVIVNAHEDELSAASYTASADSIRRRCRQRTVRTVFRPL